MNTSDVVQVNLCCLLSEYAECTVTGVKGRGVSTRGDYKRSICQVVNIILCGESPRRGGGGGGGGGACLWPVIVLKSIEQDQVPAESAGPVQARAVANTHSLHSMGSLSHSYPAQST